MINEEKLAEIIKAIDNRTETDKSKNTLADWVEQYGGRETTSGTVEFGSYYAIDCMVTRRDCDVIRGVLKAIGLYPENKEEQ